MNNITKKEYMHLSDSGKNNEEAIRRLVEIVRILRRECPWDREQTHESLIPGMIEESYEVVDAIKQNDVVNLREELGDVLLQVIFHSQIEEEAGNFEFCHVINEECEKMIRRHPHVFLFEKENNEVKSIDKVLEKWENIKDNERKEKNVASQMKKVPKALPALMRAYKLQKKAAGIGFDWEDISGALEKVTEEFREVKECLNQEALDINRQKEEIGDLLFSVVNVSRFLGINPEEALDFSNEKFVRRFSYVEENGLACGKTLKQMGLSEMDKLWNEAKNMEHSV